MKNKKTTPKSSPKQSEINSKLKTFGKLDSMLYRFALGERHHRFTAERVGDHCLHTTISDLQKRHFLYFHRHFVQVPNRFGSVTSVKLYWLKDESLQKARDFFGLDKEVA